MYKCSVNILNPCLIEVKKFIEKAEGKILHEANIGTWSMLTINFSNEEHFWNLVAEKWKLEDKLKNNLNTYL